MFLNSFRFIFLYCCILSFHNILRTITIKNFANTSIYTKWYIVVMIYTLVDMESCISGPNRHSFILDINISCS